MSVTNPIDLEFAPGMLKTSSKVGARGRVIDGDKVRTDAGRWQKIGGWQKLTTDLMVGIARGAFGWTTQAGSSLLATGTQSKLYSVSDMIQDITPLRTSGTLGADPLTTANGSKVVTVHHVSHGLVTGATAVFGGATAVNLITVSGAYLVTITGADDYTITTGTTANGTSSGGGASVTYAYEINPGTLNTAYGVGYGSGLYGKGTYGTPRSVTNGLSNAGGIANEARVWSFDNYGNQLLALPSGGTVYSWDQVGGAARAVAISNAPASARFMFMTPERMIVMLGTSLPMTMAWCDRNNNTVWTAAVGNTANTRTLQDGNRLIAGTSFSSGISLIWSDTAAYLMQYLDSTGEIYSTRVIATGCGLIAPDAFDVAPDAAMWMGDSNFYIYAGGVVQKAPRQDEIRAYILGELTNSGVHIEGRLDKDYASKIACSYNAKFNEMWWSYPSVDSLDGENDEYLFVKMDDWSWYTGTWNVSGTTIARTAMAHSKNPNGGIYMACGDSYIREHEIGVDADGAALPWELQTGPVTMTRGATDMDVIGFVPDFERQSETIDVVIRTQDRPQSASYLDDQSFSVTPTDTLVDMKLGGRYADMNLSGDEAGSDFRMGIPQLEVGVGGDRR